MTRLTRMLDAGDQVPDEVLLEELKENKLLIDEEFFRKCLTGRLPNSAKYLIQQDQDQNHLGKCLSDPEMPSIIFEIEEEQVIIQVMRTYKKSSWKIRSVVPETKANLLHFLVSKGFDKALSDMLNNEMIQEDVRELCFQQDKAKQIPLMAILSQEMEESAMELWTFMEKSGTNVDKETSKIDREMENALSMIDSRKDNIFHICSDKGQNQVLSALC